MKKLHSPEADGIITTMRLKHKENFKMNDIDDKKCLNPKEETLRIFLERLYQSEIVSQILHVIHYGSTFRGDCHPESDIDVLIVSGGNLQRVQRVCDELSFDLMLEFGELVEPMITCIEEYRQPFHLIRRAMKEGKEVWQVKESQARRIEAGDLAALAREYLNTVQSLDRNRYPRAAVDLSYNAAELCAKGLILLQGIEIATTHSGIVNQFGQHVVKKGKTSPDLGRELRRSLRRRNQARYDPHAMLSEKDVNEVVKLTEEMLRELDGQLEQ
jgi:uncharacterized protein (UPF0332 family)/predicted nucleotidyltransferase